VSLDGGWRPPDLQSLEAAGDVTEATLPEIYRNLQFGKRKKKEKIILSVVTSNRN
jgi:hypothetical protein